MSFTTSFQLSIRILLKTYYNEPHRFYHTLSHIDAMTDAYQKYFGESTPAEHLAILYHDAIYNPWSKTNEEDSVKLMMMHSKMYFPHVDKKLLEDVSIIVLDTKHNGKPINTLSHRVSDLDLMILGAKSETYNKYVQNIRKEYCMYSDDEWFPGRIKVLEHILSVPRLYHTDEVFSVFEQAARQNMLNEIEECKLTVSL